MGDIADADYAHRKGVCKDFKMKNLGEYHDLYGQIDTLLLADVFENFRNMCFIRGGSRINIRVLQNFTKKIEHRSDSICRKIIDSARSKKVQF